MKSTAPGARLRECGQGDDPSRGAAASAMGVQQVLMAPGAYTGAVHVGGGETRANEARRCLRGQVHMGFSPGAGVSGSLEPLGHLGPHLEATDADGRSDQGDDPPGVIKGRDRGLENTVHQTAPTGMHQGEPLVGVTQEHRQAVGGAHGDEQARGSGSNRVAGGETPGGLGPANGGSMDLFEAHRGTGERRRGTQLPATKGQSTQTTRQGIGCQMPGSLDEAPGPVHDARA